MDINFETAMAMIDDKNPYQYKLDNVSSDVRSRIDAALTMIFEGLTLMHWLDGCKLSHAWRSALDTMQPIGFDIPGDNPVVLYLRRANFQYRRKWEPKIVSSRNGDDYIKCPPNRVEQWRQHGHDQVRDGMELIRQTLATAAPIEKTVQIVNTKQQSRQNTRIHEHEYEREYERTREK